MSSIKFKVINDNGNIILTSTLLTADQVRQLIENGYIDDVPSDWNPNSDAVNRILDGMAEDLESSATITETLVNEVAESARFAIPMIYGDEQDTN